MTEAYPAPIDDAALEATWLDAWASFGRPAPTGLEAELLAAWSEPHRHYHDQRHLRECMALWLLWRHRCKHSGAVVVALWFHEAVFALKAKDNERASPAGLRDRCWARASTSQSRSACTNL